MPNAKDMTIATLPRILILGDSGCGKTTQFLTFPGKKFSYIFDPNAALSMRGHDVDYEEFFPEDIYMGLTSLKKETKDRHKAPAHYGKRGAEVYQAWEKDAEKKLDEGFFDNYDAICLDSFTTLADLVMDGILAINGRAGQFPEQDDWPAQMTTLTNIIRRFVGLGKTLYVTGHNELKQDAVTHKIVRQPVMTGRLKVKLPLLFSEVLQAEVNADQSGNVKYLLQTRPDRQNSLVRTAMRGVEYKEDVSLDFSQPVEGQGLAEVLRRGGVIS